MADDLGFADVSCYGQREYTTPNVSRLPRRKRETGSGPVT
jgi:arylsulfatase A-like enzyme